jgi:hypothetical protein
VFLRNIRNLSGNLICAALKNRRQAKIKKAYHPEIAYNITSCVD